MARTADRPVPAGRLAPRRRCAFGIALGGASFVVLTLTVNVLAAALAFSGFLGYVFVYTSGSSAARRRTSSSAAPPARCRRWWAGPRSPEASAALRDLPVRDRLLLDAAALLGAVAAHEGRVRQGRRPDAARRARRGRDAPPDPALHASCCTRSRSCRSARGGFGADLPRRLARARRGVHRRRRRGSSAGPTAASALQLYLFSLLYLALLFVAMVADVKL